MDPWFCSSIVNINHRLLQGLFPPCNITLYTFFTITTLKVRVRMDASYVRHIDSIMHTHSLTHTYTHTHSHSHTHTEFYRRLGFQELLTIPDYYFIRNKPADGLLFCCYVNGGQAFVGGVRSYLRRYITETALCRVLTQLWTYVCHVMRTTLQRNKFYSFYTC